MQKNRRGMIHFFMILALINVLASPACAFISQGKTLWEVCGNTSYDSQTTIKIDPKVASFIVSTDSEQQSPKAPNHYSEQCQFCFSSNHVAKQITVLGSYDAPIFISRAKNIFTSNNANAPSIAPLAYQTRAPPTFS